MAAEADADVLIRLTEVWLNPPKEHQAEKGRDLRVA